MKTKEQVISHLEKNGYTKKALCKILGFLIGVGVKEESEEFYVKVSGDLKWSDFWEWWNKDDDEFLNEEDILLSIIEDIADRYSKAEDERERERYETQIGWLVDEFGIEYEEEEDINC